MYHKTLSECLRRIKDMKDKGEDKNKIAIMVASHNEDTVRFAIQNMNDIGILPEDKVICFGQLLGMCDYITFPLGKLKKLSRKDNKIALLFALLTKVN